MTDEFRDPHYLARGQYGDASRLNARKDLHARFSTNPYGWYRWVFDRVLEMDGERVLEIGAGPGDLWSENRGRVPAQWRITLTDLSIGMLRSARAALPSCRAAAADAHALPFSDGCFDAVIANHMLYHVRDIDRALSEIRRVLRPGGTLYAATNGIDHMRELREWSAQLGKRVVLTESDETAFNLDNGAEMLAHWFDRIRVERYEDHLDVTEVEPVLAYLRSTVGGETLGEHDDEDYRRFFDRVLREQGAIRLSKDAGMFIVV